MPGSLKVPVEQNIVDTKSTSPGNKRLFMTVTVIVIFLVLLVAAISATVGGVASRRTTTNQTAVTSVPQQPDNRQIVENPIQSRIVEVVVGTNWYDPNEHNLRVRISGHPKPNVGNGVRWQMRARYSSGTQRIVDMPTIDSGDVSHVEFAATDGRATLTAIDYRVAPGQSSTSCAFHFDFAPLE